MDEDDPGLAVTVEWIDEFCQYAENFHVLALRVGEHDLPDHVNVHSLGRDEGASRLTVLYRMFNHFFRLMEELDGLFIHQGQIYSILLGPLCNIMNIPVVMWKTHGELPWTMHIGLNFVNRILTADEKSFPIDTQKKIVSGHGIHTERFTPTDQERDPFCNETIRIVSIGRISQTKRTLEKVQLIKEGSKHLELTLIGGPMTEEEREYWKEVQRYISKHQLSDRVHHLGEIPYEQIPEKLEQYDLFLHYSEPPSIDKSVLEAMLMKRPVITANKGYSDIKPLSDFPYYSKTVNPALVEELINHWKELPSQKLRNYQQKARQWVENNHSLPHLV
ncbi:MAG: glycosyltransferase family 4 protein, partial [bacterium]